EHAAPGEAAPCRGIAEDAATHALVDEPSQARGEKGVSSRKDHRAERSDRRKGGGAGHHKAERRRGSRQHSDPRETSMARHDSPLTLVHSSPSRGSQRGFLDMIVGGPGAVTQAVTACYVIEPSRKR